MNGPTETVQGSQHSFLFLALTKYENLIVFKSLVMHVYSNCISQWPAEILQILEIAGGEKKSDSFQYARGLLVDKEHYIWLFTVPCEFKLH